MISTYIPNDSYCNTLLHVLKLKNQTYSYKSILSILNSSLIGWYFRKKFQISNDDTFPQIMIRDILQFPVPEIGSIQAKELEKNGEMLIKLNKERQDISLHSKAEQLQAHIIHCEDKINEIVYQLYGLTGDEIKTVEESLNK